MWKIKELEQLAIDWTIFSKLMSISNLADFIFIPYQSNENNNGGTSYNH